jgi:hypothetical protein
MVQVTESGATIVTGEHIRLYSLISLKQAIVLEGKGMKMSRGVSAMALAKRRYGLKGSREKIIAQMQSMIDQFTAADEDEENPE